MGELVAPATFGRWRRVAYPMALVLLLADLACLVLDLGDPLRFHHMLRVFKPSSPMSLGTWCLTAYSVPLTALMRAGLLPAWRRRLGGARAARWSPGGRRDRDGGLQGVLFSTMTRPGATTGRSCAGKLRGQAGGAEAAGVPSSVNRAYRSRAEAISSWKRGVGRRLSRNRSCRVKYT